MRVPFVDFQQALNETRGELTEAFNTVLDGGTVILGPQTAEFEKEFAAFCGVAHAIGVGNGLDALSLCLRAWGIGPGDEVIVPSQTFIASWLAVSHVGATPVEVDVDPLTYTLAPSAVEAALTPRTRAIMPVHLYGHPADMDPIMAIAAERGLFVLEDAAQAHGAEYKGRRCGGLGHAAGFSFYPTKNLGALGDGGAITTDDAELDQRIRSLRNYGSTRKYHHEEIGYNTRLDELQSAMLRVKLRRLEAENERRRALARAYSSRLDGQNSVVAPHEAEWAKHVYHLYVVQTDERDELAQALDREGVSTLVHYPLAPGESGAYAEQFGGDVAPEGRALARRALSLPMWPTMSNAQLDYVADRIIDARLPAAGA